MDYKIVLLPEAKEDLKSINMYYALNFTQKSALKVTNAILDTITKLERFPNLGTIIKIDDMLREKGFRIILSGDYGSIYRVINSKIYIYHIVNVKMDYKKLFYDEKNNFQQ